MSTRHVSLRSVAIAAVAVAVTGCAEDPLRPFAESTPGFPQGVVAAASDAPAAITASADQIVMFRNGGVPAEFSARVDALGGVVSRVVAPIGIAVVAGLDATALEQLAAEKYVAAIETDEVIALEDLMADEAEEVTAGVAAVTSIDPSAAFFYPRQWHHRAIFAHDAWAAGYLGSSDVVVSIIDSGLDYNHASLEGRVDLERSISLLPAEDETVASLFPGAHPVADLNRHGTHVGATVVSTGEVGAGVTAYTTLFGVKVCGWDTGCPRSAVLEAIVYSADQGADIINMSLGGTIFRSSDRGNWIPLILRATNYAKSKGALIVVSAGNDGQDLDHNRDAFKSYCDSTNVVCVAGTGPTARGSVDGPWNDFDQSYTSTNFGRSAVDVAAPSGNTNNFVYAACSSFSLVTAGCRASNRFIIGLRGTSMAAPHVSGVAALIAAHVPGAKGNPALIRNHLAQTADDIGELGTDAKFGKGRVNAARAVGM